MSSSDRREVYSHGYDAHTIRQHAAREATTEAAFFLPHIRSGMALLDCGSGPGSITAGLAKVVALGDTVGIDIEPTVVEQARENATSQGLSNLRFEVASIYELPFPDESFDAVFAHTVLQHLSEPVKALGEIHRVMKPGGVVGLRESDSVD